jgi:hypothetical protein
MARRHPTRDVGALLDLYVGGERVQVEQALREERTARRRFRPRGRRARATA